MAQRGFSAHPSLCSLGPALGGGCVSEPESHSDAALTGSPCPRTKHDPNPKTHLLPRNEPPNHPMTLWASRMALLQGSWQRTSDGTYLAGLGAVTCHPRKHCLPGPLELGEAYASATGMSGVWKLREPGHHHPLSLSLGGSREGVSLGVLGLFVTEAHADGYRNLECSPW